jgi:peptidoglycan/LPS O-acetylase OafA/YrhL
MPALSRVKFGRFTGLIVTVAVVFWAKSTTPRLALGLLLFAVLMVILADPRDLLSRFLSLSPIVYLGEISYSLYMVHWPARIIMRNGFQIFNLLDTLPPALVVSSYVLVTVLGAMASYHFVELPGRALLRRAAAVYGQARISTANARLD